MAAERRDGELALIALQAPDPLPQDAEIHGPRTEWGGFPLVHLDVMESAAGLPESRVDDQFTRGWQGTIGPGGPIGQVRQDPKSVGIVGRERADDHGVGGPEGDHRLDDGLPVRVGLMSLLHQPQDVRKVLGPVRDPAGAGPIGSSNRGLTPTWRDDRRLHSAEVPMILAADPGAIQALRPRDGGPHPAARTAPPEPSWRRGASLATSTMFRGETSPIAASRRSWRGMSISSVIIVRGPFREEGRCTAAASS